MDRKMTTHQENHLDNIFHAMGEFKMFAIIQILLMSLIGPPTSYQLLSNVFICQDVPYQCASAPSDSSRLFSGLQKYDTDQLNISYQQCSIEVSSNKTVLKTEDCIYGMAYEKGKDASVISQFDLVCDKSSLPELSQTLIMAGQGVGAAFFTFLSDRYGRKPMLVLSNFGLGISGIIIAYAPNYTIFAVFKFIVGAFQQGCAMTLSTIVMEMLTTKSRRLHTFVMGLVWSLSFMSLPLWAWLLRHESWRTLQMVLTLSSLPVIPQLLFGRESLRWLIANGKTKAVVSYINNATKMNGTSFQKTMRAYEEASSLTAGEGNIQDFGKAAATETLTLLDLLRIKRLLINSVIMWLAWFTTALSYFTIYVLSSSMAGDQYLNFFMTASMEILSIFILYPFINRLGRRPMMIVVFLLVGVGTALNATFKSFEQTSVNAAFVLIFSCIAMVGSAAAFNLVYFYTTEIFPTNMRNQAVGVASMVGRIGSMVAPFTGVLVEKATWAPGVMIGGCAFIVCVASIFLPETRGKELPQTIEDVKAWYNKTNENVDTSEKRKDANDEL